MKLVKSSFIKTMATLVVGLVFALTSFSANAAEKGYTELSKPQQAAFEKFGGASDSHTIYEFFSYGCSHCDHLEPQLEKWIKSHKGIKLVKIPVSFGSGPWEVTAKAYYVAESLGNEKTLTPKIFSAIHVDKEKLYTEDALQEFFKKQGVSKAKFDVAYNSFGVAQQLRKDAALIKKVGITGVPTLVVDGKYLTSVAKAGSPEAMFKVIEKLVADSFKEEGLDKGKIAGAVGLSQ